MTIDDVINAKKLDFITKVYRQGEYTRVFQSNKVLIDFLEMKFEKCVSLFMDVTGQVLFRDLETFFMECHDAVVNKKSK